jgi:hypothetical protein
VSIYSENSERLTSLAADSAYSVPFVKKGEAPFSEAQRELTSMANDLLRGQMPRPRYTLADKYSDRPKYQHSPYRTAVMHSSGKGGRRSVGERW